METNRPEGEEETGGRERDRNGERCREEVGRETRGPRKKQPRGDMGLFLRPRDYQEEGPQGPEA